PQASLASFPDAERIAKSIFINGGEVETAPLTSAQRSARSLPSPLAPYRITYALGDEIIQTPMADIDGATTGSLHLSHHGNTVSVGGAFGGNAWFYAPRRNTLTDLSDSIFAASDAAPAPQVASRPAFPTLAPGNAEIAIARTRTFDVQAEYQQSANQQPGTRFVYWRNFANNSYSRDLLLNDVVTSNTVGYEFRLIGYNQTTTENPDHTVNMHLAGVTLPQQQWEGRTVYTFNGTMNLNTIPVNKIQVTHQIPAAGYADLQFLDIVKLDYTAYPRINDRGIGTVDVPAGATPQLRTIGGFPAGTTAADVILLDITDPLAPVRLLSPSTFIDTNGTVAIEFEVPAAGGTF
ncbi:MAG TPA: hypothetical protein PKH51_13170, partial [Candidatus Sumerlaeota bacterium]|nr:hypothetical protein [Candidatus Sumerlaeota bacterium]